MQTEATNLVDKLLKQNSAKLEDLYQLNHSKNCVARLVLALS